jgi:hypothetical protein
MPRMSEFVFIDIVKNGHCGAPVPAALSAKPVRRAIITLFGISLRLPTASGLPLYETVTSVRRRFFGSSQAGHCLPQLIKWGGGCKETMADWKFIYCSKNHDRTVACWDPFDPYKEQYLASLRKSPDATIAR